MTQILDWRPYFPLPSARPEQSRALDYIVDQFVGKGVNYVIAELGTGIGKSAIAVTIARWMRAWSAELVDLEIIQDPDPQAYILTSQKILQDQYCNDFRSLTTDLRSSANFSCSWLNGQTCAEILRIKRALNGNDCLSTVECKGDTSGDCPYRAAKEFFKKHHIGITNYSYFLSETVYAGGLKPRELIIFDEAHNIEGEVRRWATITIREDFSKNELGVPFPKRPRNIDFIAWIEERYVPALAALMNLTLSRIKNSLVASGGKYSMGELTKKYEVLDKHLCQVNRYVEEKGGSRDNYLMVWDRGSHGRSVAMKPLHITWQARKFLYERGKKRLFMSATVLNEKTFKRSAGIPSDERCGFLSISSPFPKENRPVFIAGVGPMVKKHIDQTLPKMADAVRKLIDFHHDEKGIVHCLAGNTEIALTNGSIKTLDVIEPGDRVVSWNEKTQIFEPQDVLDVWDNGVRECIEIEFEEGRIITCTSEHRFLTKNRGWIMAKDLDENDDVVDTVHDTYMHASTCDS